MGYCRYCEIFSNSYDEMVNVFADDKNDEEIHFCVAYINGIPKKIYKGKKNCVYFVEKRGDNERNDNRQQQRISKRV